jgi:imidazolonepropionase-like amidohydrolase
MPILFLLSLALQDTTQYIVLNHGRPAGEMRVISAGDSAVVRYVYQDRQRGPRLENTYKFGTGGAVTRIEQRGVNAAMFPTEVSDKWEPKPADQGKYYMMPAQTPYDDALLAKYLLKQPNRSASLLPVGQASLEIVADTTVTGPGGSRRIRLAMIAMEGGHEAVWLDEQDRIFASGSGWFVTLPRGWESVLEPLRATEMRWRVARSAAIAERLGKQPAGAVVIRNGDLFDSETGTVRPRMTVVINGDRIEKVGPADSVTAPAGARVIDATGKTIIPGLWDMHTHAFLSSEQAGLAHLGSGVTTVRDVAADIDVALSQRERAKTGTLIGPRMILAGFIEGPGFWSGPSEVLVRTEAEARSWVAKYDSMGYKQIKLYNIVHPDLVPTIAEEAHKRGMRLSGHIPRGLTVQAAVTLGFDEFQHMAFLFSTFFQDSLYLPRMRAYSQVSAAVAPTFNVDAPEVTALLSFLREKGTVVDGTFNIWQNRAFTLPDGNDPVFGPTIAWMPPLLQRAMKTSPPSSPQEAGRARAADANYRRMLKRVYDAGITMVPGTDNMAGLSLLGELEIYERAGIPAPNVLQIATIVPARVMKDDKEYGSVSAGKIADIVIVNGRPAEKITDLRKTETVIRGGKVFNAAELLREAGFNPK